MSPPCPVTRSSVNHPGVYSSYHSCPTAGPVRRVLAKLWGRGRESWGVLLVESQKICHTGQFKVYLPQHLSEDPEILDYKYKMRTSEMCVAWFWEGLWGLPEETHLAPGRAEASKQISPCKFLSCILKVCLCLDVPVVALLTSRSNNVCPNKKIPKRLFLGHLPHPQASEHSGSRDIE